MQSCDAVLYTDVTPCRMAKLWKIYVSEHVALLAAFIFWLNRHPSRFLDKTIATTINAAPTISSSLCTLSHEQLAAMDAINAMNTSPAFGKVKRLRQSSTLP